jgi:hypothetical protein
MSPNLWFGSQKVRRHLEGLGVHGIIFENGSWGNRFAESGLD